MPRHRLAPPAPGSAAENAPAATPMAFVEAIVQAYEARGMCPGRALEQAQIAPQLRARPDARITALQFERLSEAAMRELDDEALGWFTRRLPWGSYGMLARASITAPTLRIALARWCRHHALLADDIGLSLGDDAARGSAGSGGVAGGDGAAAGTAPPLACLVLREHRDLGRLREFCTVSVLRNALGVSSWMVDSRLPVTSAQFAFAAPAHADAYAVLFPGAAVTFGAPQSALYLDARYLALPLRRDDAALRQMLQHALPLTVLQYRRDRLLVQRVRQILGAPVPGTSLHALPALAPHSAESLAALLHLSARTLHRQLKDEGATLQGLKDSVRQSRATWLLHRTDRPIKQVAEAAGFANEKSFIRAFKGWTGQSPAEFRRTARP